MKEKILLFTLIVMSAAGTVHGKKVSTLAGIMNPRSLAVDENRLYVAEQVRVTIFSLKDFKLIKAFGREGQGPREFQTLPHVPISVDVSGDFLIVASMGKISYFTKTGEFVREVRARSLALNLRRCGDRFLGWSQAREEGVIYNTINIFDRELSKIKEVYRHKDSYQGPGKGYRVLHKTFAYRATDDHILLPGDDDAAIDIFDHQMQKIVSIRLDQKRRTVPPAFRDRLIHHLKTSPETKNVFERIKPIIFPDTFPVIADFFVDAPLVYIMTWKRDGGTNEFFIYDLKSDFKKRLMIPIRYETELRPYPALIYGGSLYQLVENPATEEWELHRYRLSF